MPDLQSHQALFRQGAYSFDGFLSVIPKRILFSRAINQASFPDQLTSLTFDNPYSGAGAYTDVPEDAEIVVYDQNTSTIKGRLRVAYGGASSTVIQVNEVSAGRINLADNDRFEVWDEYRLRDKLVAATATFDKDSRRAYSDEGTHPAPVAVAGGARAGRVDPATGLLTRTFDASASYPIDPDNTGGLDYLWDVADGTITVGTTTTSSITVTFPASSRAHRHVTLTVTDHDNSKSTVRKIPVFSYDFTNTHPTAVKKVTLSGSKADGWGATFEMTASGVDTASMPDGCLVAYWEREYYNGTEVSYGNQEADCNNVKFVGYLRRETISIDPDTDTLTFEAISPLQKLAELAGFSQDLKTLASPTTWQEDEQVTIHKLAWYVLQYHTTWGVNYDLVVSGSDYDFSEFAIQQAALKAQMNEVVQGISKLFTCDRTGRFLIARSLQRGTTTERNNAITTLALTTRDLKEIPTLTYEHGYTYNSLIGKFFTPAGIAMLSVAPGEAPAEAPEQTSFERGIAADQTEANWIANQAWAEANGLYNGSTVPQGVTLKPKMAYDVVDPAYNEWLTLTLASTTNRRGRAFAADRFVLQRVEITCDPDSGTKDITWTVDHETLGQGAVTRDVPEEVDLPPYSPYPPTPIALPAPRVPAETGALPARLLRLNATYPKLALITSVSSATDTCTSEDRSTGLTGAGRWQYCDPFLFERLYVATADGLFASENVQTGTAFVQKRTNLQLFGSPGLTPHFAFGSINRNGFGCVVCRESNVISVTLDGWTTSTPVTVNAASDEAWYPMTVGGIEGSPGHLWAANGKHIARSTDYGLTWTNYNTNRWDLVNNAVSWEFGYTRADSVTRNTDDGALLECVASATGDRHNGSTHQTVLARIFPDASTDIAGSVQNSYSNGESAGDHGIGAHPATTFTWDGGDIYFVQDYKLYHTSDGLVTVTLLADLRERYNSLNGYPTNRGVVFIFTPVQDNLQPTAQYSYDGGTSLHPLLPIGWGEADGCANLQGALF